MTREEEAIRRLDVYSSTNGSGLCTDKQHNEAKQIAIEALEQTRWIPVSERLPEEDDFYLVTAKVGNELIIDISEYTPKTDFWDIPHEIVAWMPLPKPYKAESEDK